MCRPYGAYLAGGAACPGASPRAGMLRPVRGWHRRIAAHMSRIATVQPILVVQTSCLPLWRGVCSPAGKMPAPQRHAPSSVKRLNCYGTEMVVYKPAL